MGPRSKMTPHPPTARRGSTGSRATASPRDRVYHLDLSPGDLPPIVLVPGDVDRVQKIISTWEAPELLARKREFVSYRGLYRGVPLGVTSTGIGGPAMSIALEELAQVGARTLIRVGSCGSLKPEVLVGDLVVSRASYRMDGASLTYAPAGYPASADPDVYQALVQAAKGLGVRYHSGITASVDSFYSGQGRPGFRGYVAPPMRSLLQDLVDMNITNIEMESATLLTLANLFGLRAGVVCAVYDQIGQKDLTPRGEQEAIRVANEAARRLATLG